jgi:two-component system, cell cycle response regulator
MSGRILLVDSIATNRIVLRVKLLAAHYAVTPCASLDEARASMSVERPDLILIDLSGPAIAAYDFCRAIKAEPDTMSIPIIATGSFPTPSARIGALRAGADDVLEKPLNDALLQARIRSLLRARDATSELRLREDTQRALGFAEDAQGFTPLGRVAVVTDTVADPTPSLTALMERLPQPYSLLESGRMLTAEAMTPLPDLFIIDGAGGQAGAPVPGDIFRMVADLRSRSETRHAAQLVILPENASDMAAMVLDLGANDLVTARVGADELAHRVRALLQRKSQADRLRDTVRHGLQAAVTDQLTGLYNRRYAMPHLAKMAERAQAKGRDFALMMLDIDHFKTINDQHGHAVGDKVLAEVACRLRDNLRAVDLIARIGGEEFLVAMPDTTVAQGQVAAERLRRMVEGTPFSAQSDLPGPGIALSIAPPKIRVTLSIGVAVGGPSGEAGEDVDKLFARADAALYCAKSAGRNMVTVSQSAA